MSTFAVGDDDFDAQVLQSDVPVLVDFWAEWCGPCKQLAPALEAVALELGDKLKIAKVDIEENPMTPTKYGVKGIPTMILFRGGQTASIKVGAVPKAKLLEWLADAGVS